MPMPPEIKALLPGVITLERYEGEDQWGNDTYHDPETGIPAFVESTTQSLGTTEAGTQHSRLVTTYSIITDAIGIKPGDLITLPGPVKIVVEQVAAPALDIDGTPVMQTSTAVQEKVVA